MDKTDYVTCWPPSPTENETSGAEVETATDGVEQEPFSKLRKLEDQPTCSHPREEGPQKQRIVSDAVTMEKANLLLAKWWRKFGKSYEDRLNVPCKSVSPETLLEYISRLPEAKLLVKGQVERLEQMLIKEEVHSAQLHTVLGTLHEKLGHSTEAFHHFNCASSMEPTDGQIQWHLQKVLRQLKVIAAQSVARSRLPRGPLQIPQPCKVDRRPAASLSYEEFLLRYAMTRTPVVITGLESVITKRKWDLKYLNDAIGTCKVDTRRLVPGSVEWAQLESGPTLTVRELLRRIEQPESDSEQLYLFDWSLPLHAPHLAEELTIPKYFASDFLQRTSEGTLYRDSWPSLFVAPEGLRSELHIDTFGSNFWMALLSGSKRWIFYSPGDAPLLYPRYNHSLDPMFEVDLCQPDLDKFPLVALARPQEVILNEGELLFVPAGCPHRVENLSHSVAISANYVDLSNLADVKGELADQALVDPRAGQLLAQLEHTGFDTGLQLGQTHVPFDRFKKPSRAAVK